MTILVGEIISSLKLINLHSSVNLLLKNSVGTYLVQAELAPTWSWFFMDAALALTGQLDLR